MALTVPQEQIDPTDPRIRNIVCLGCYKGLWVERGSVCDAYTMCSACSLMFDGALRKSRNDS
jgi:hypothetical protein